MAVFFKISDDGNAVYVAKTLLVNEIGEKEFDEKARRISVDDFLSRFPKSLSEKLEKNIKRVKEINNMNLARIYVTSSSNPVSRTTYSTYHIGNVSFRVEAGEEAQINQYNEAKTYVEKTFGKEAVEKYLRNADYKGFYFSGTKEITEDKYNQLQEEKQKLTSIICLKKGQELVNGKVKK